MPKTGLQQLFHVAAFLILDLTEFHAINAKKNCQKHHLQEHE